MFIEHIGISCTNPFEMADWYVLNLDCKIIRKIHKGDKADAVFITDMASSTVLEITCEPSVQPLCKVMTNPSQLHLAFYCDDPRAECKRLSGAGASYIGETKASPDDILLYLSDPWGNTIQLVKRKEALK